jgi:hypothetical protein
MGLPGRRRRRPYLGALAGAVLLGAALCGCSRGNQLGEYEAARTLHLAPDGRLLVTDLGAGRDDGAVVAVEVDSGRRTTLMRDLPSTHGSGQSHADLAGPSGADMAADGTVCVVIGDATKTNAGFATLRCSSGLVVDLEAFQARSKQPSNPYDVVWDGEDGWYVSDGAANNLLHVDRAGKIVEVASFPGLQAAGLGNRKAQGVPTGLARGRDGTLYVALYGGAPFDGPPAAVVSLPPGAGTGTAKARPKLLATVPHPIAVAVTPDGLAVVDYGGGPGGEDRGEVRLFATGDGVKPGPGRLLASRLEGPTGVARLPDGRLVVAETGRHRLRVLPADRS